MKYVESGYSIRVNWTIQRGASRVQEDFRRASLFVFLIGRDNVYPVNYTLEDNVIKAVIEPGLPEGVYGLKAIWYKDSLSPMEKVYLHNGKCPYTYGRESQSRVDHVFGITALSEESESSPENTLYIDITTAVATYGYDGLSAYEIAVLSGHTTASQDAWVGNLADLNDRMRDIEDAEQARNSGEKQRVAVEYTRKEAEQTRQEAESGRVSAEQERVLAEAERVKAERARQEAEALRTTIQYYTEQSGKAVLRAPEVVIGATGSGKVLSLTGYKVLIQSGLDHIVLSPGAGYKVLIGTSEVATVDMLESIKKRLDALEEKG